MIRPITLICCAAACGSGLYLYQAKHRVHVLDQQIEQTVKLTEHTRAQTRMLHAEWTLLNDPDRLRKLAAQFLPQLQPVSPTQYTDMADLNARLPAVPPLPPPAPPGLPGSTPDSGVPVAQAAPPVAATTPATEPVRTVAAAPPQTGTPPAKAAIPQQQIAKAAAAPPRQHATAPRAVAARPAVAQVHRPPVGTDSRLRDAAYDPRAVERDRHQRAAGMEMPRQQYRPAPQPVYRRPMIAEAAAPRFVRPAPPQPYNGSLLGMAQGRPTLPPPRPMPVSNYGNSTKFEGGN